MNQDNFKRQYFFKVMLSLNTTHDANKDPKHLLTPSFQFYRNIHQNIRILLEIFKVAVTAIATTLNNASHTAILTCITIVKYTPTLLISELRAGGGKKKKKRPGLRAALGVCVTDECEAGSSTTHFSNAVKLLALMKKGKLYLLYLLTKYIHKTDPDHQPLWNELLFFGPRM